jgi:imidazole glycerol-phosphate synthase subunit HisH
MITIVDYGMGNLGSVVNMFRRIGYVANVAYDVETIFKAEKLLLPGVGSFGTAMKLIDGKGLRGVLNEKALIEKIPVLGICLGMQLLTRSSEESPGIKGLGWIPAETKRFKFPEKDKMRVPHMGWNAVSLPKISPLTTEFATEPRFYFVHSYFVEVDDPQNSIMRTTYGVSFDSGIQKENIYGTQFHPEKSHKFGMKLFENFVRI